MSSIDRKIYFDHRFQNRIQTVILLLALLGLLALIGWLLAGWIGILVACLMCLGSAIFSQRASPAMVLRMFRAQPIRHRDDPELIEIFAALAKRAEIDPVPGLFYIRSRSPNAFAVGRQGNGAVALTDGILRLMNAREIAGVLAHELAHIKNGDTRVMAVADTVARMIANLSQLAFIAVLFGAPLALRRNA